MILLNRTGSEEIQRALLGEFDRKTVSFSVNATQRYAPFHGRRPQFHTRVGRTIWDFSGIGPLKMAGWR
jgi:hypothetical protein